MAGISTPAWLADQMGPALRAVSVSMNLVSSSLVSMQAASSQAVDTAVFRAARVDLLRMDVAVNQVGSGLRGAADDQQDLNRKMKEGQDEAGRLFTKVMKAVAAFANKDTLKTGIDFAMNATDAYSTQKQYETGLQAAMGQNMGAGQVEFQAVLDTVSMQQQTGVISDQVQLSGAGQLASYLSSAEALNTLIPAMNDLAVSQNGCSASAEDLASIGSMMGDAMQGQVGALANAGVTFTEAQGQVMAYGNEQERAAMLAQVITDNVGQMNAAIANTPQGIITQMKNSWESVIETIGQRLYPSVMMVLQTLQSHMPQVTAAVAEFANAMMPGIEWLASTGIPAVLNAASFLLEIVSGAGSFIADNWGLIEPIIWGLAGAFALYTIALGICAAVTWITNAATKAFFITLLTNPLFWVAIVIGLVIAAIVAFINHIGGLRIAWLICVNAVLTAADNLKLAFSFLSMKIQDVLGNLQYGFAAFKVGVLNALGNLKVAGLTILEGFINGAIDRINSLIELTNRISGLSIKTIDHVEFAATAAVEEEGQQKQRADDLAAQAEEKSAASKARQQDHRRLELQAKADQDFREWEIQKLREEGKKSAQEGAEANGYIPGASGYDEIAGGVSGIGGNTGNTAANTARMTDTMDIMEEELKYMRDAAEQEIINRFTLAELKVDVSNNNTLTKKADFDDMGRFLSEFTSGFLAAAAEGGHL